MKNILLISEDEKRLILNKHISYGYNTFINEQVVTNYDKIYDYKQDGNNFYVKKKGTDKWIQLSGTQLNDVKTKVFKIFSNNSNKNSSSHSIPKELINSGGVKKFQEWIYNKQPELLGKFGIDGKYGSITKNAWEKYGKQYLNQLSSGSTTTLQNFIKKIIPTKKSLLPLHIRALMDYLIGRETPFTEDDLTRDEQNFLKNVVISNEKKGLTYSLWKQIGGGNLPTSMTVQDSEKEKQKLLDKGGQGNLIKPELAGQFMYTLGQVTPENIKISPDKSIVTIYDRYDFNVQGKTKEELIKSFTEQLKSWSKGHSTLYSIIRNLIAFREKGGYKGFPIKITV